MCSYHPLLRSRWRLCCLTDAAHPLRVPLCQFRSGAAESPSTGALLNAASASNAAFGMQSAAVLPSLVPHDSKARLQAVTTRRGSWRSHVHRTNTAQRVQSFKRPTANVGGRGGRPSSFSGGFKGGILFEKRIPPLSRAPRQAGPPIQRPRRCKTHAPLSGAKKGAFYGTYNESHCQNPL